MYVSADEDFVDMIYPALPPIRGRRKYLILILCHNKHYIIYNKYYYVPFSRQFNY